MPSITNSSISNPGYDLSPTCTGNEGNIVLCPLEHEWGTQFCGDDLEIECTPKPIGKRIVRVRCFSMTLNVNCVYYMNTPIHSYSFSFKIDQTMGDVLPQLLSYTQMMWAVIRKASARRFE